MALDVGTVEGQQCFFPLVHLPLEVLAQVLGKMSLTDVLRVFPVNKQVAAACELVLEKECRFRKWLPPRMPRGTAAEEKFFPWRSLYRRHACEACGSVGEFPIRTELNGTLAFLICKRCSQIPAVQSRLVHANLVIDLLSLTGKRLLRKGKKAPRTCRR